MTNTFHFLGEPLLEFGHGQTAEDPHDGLALFGPADSRGQLPDNIVIGTEKGVEAWKHWCAVLNAPAACIDPSRHRAWPPPNPQGNRRSFHYPDLPKGCPQQAGV